MQKCWNRVFPEEAAEMGPGGGVSGEGEEESTRKCFLGCIGGRFGFQDNIEYISVNGG